MIRFFLCICKSVMENHYNLLYREDEECYVPHPIVGAIDKNPAQGVMLLDEKK